MPSTNPTVCGSIAARPGVFGVAMHNAAYRAMNLDFVYIAFGTEDTAGAVAAIRTFGIRGLGVTMPHKTRIAAHLDSLDDTARDIGAVNTVVNDHGHLVGHNVDWQGAIAAVREVMDPRGCRAAVIGAGGGARSIVYGLVREGADVVVYNRDANRGAALAAAFDARYGGVPSDMTGGERYDLIAHATPVGFHDPDAMLVPAGGLHPGQVVFDAVPVPIRTRLLRTAESRGCHIVPGVRMQLHQAVCQFALYTGVTPNVTVMENALFEAMKAV